VTTNSTKEKKKKRKKTTTTTTMESDNLNTSFKAVWNKNILHVDICEENIFFNFLLTLPSTKNHKGWNTHFTEKGLNQSLIDLVHIFESIIFEYKQMCTTEIIAKSPILTISVLLNELWAKHSRNYTYFLSPRFMIKDFVISCIKPNLVPIRHLEYSTHFNKELFVDVIVRINGKLLHVELLLKMSKIELSNLIKRHQINRRCKDVIPFESRLKHH
jgi:hypothetical protein